MKISVSVLNRLYFDLILCKVMQNTILKKLLLNFFIFSFIFIFPIFINNNYTFAIDSLIDNNILGTCSNPNNCVFENWKVTNADESFKELIAKV